MTNASGHKDAKETATHLLTEHAHAIDALHHRLAALHPSGDTTGKAHLQHSVETYKKAHNVLVDDVLAYLPSRG